MRGHSGVDVFLKPLEEENWFTHRTHGTVYFPTWMIVFFGECR